MRSAPLCLLAFLCLLPLTAAAQTTVQPSDSTSQMADEDDVSFGFRPRLGALYSSTKGFGLGGQVVVRNLAAPGTEVYLDARVQERYAEAGVTAFTGNPYRTRRYVGVGAQYTNDRVRRYFGVGPQTLRANRVLTHLETVEAEVRVGWYADETLRFLLQPVVRLVQHTAHSFRDGRDDAFLNLDAVSQRNLFDAVERSATGLTYGLEAAYDRRDRPSYSTRGILVEGAVRRYDGLGDNAFQYWSSMTGVYGFVPTTGRQVLFGRAVLILTEPVGDEPLPFYALPALDDRLLGSYTRDRFTGNDILALSVGYRLPLFTLYDWYAVDANVQLSAANAYDSLVDQFSPSISFDSDLRDEGERTPLRPAISLGGDIVNLDKGRILVGGQVGFDPEGYRFGTLRFVYSIRDTRPVVR